MEIDLHRLNRCLVTAAYAGGAVIRRARSVQTRKAESAIKGSHADLVTAFDHEADALIHSILNSYYPEVPINSEEGDQVDTDGSPYFSVDPIDGTLNLVHGLDDVAVSVALCMDGEPFAGAVYAPAADRLYYAARGNGATRNGVCIGVSATERVSEALLGSGWPYDKSEVRAAGNTITAVAEKAQEVRTLGSAALALCRVADGTLDGFWENDLYVWDLAAAVVIAREAGATVTRINGTPFTPARGSVVASNENLYRHLVGILNRKV